MTSTSRYPTPPASASCFCRLRGCTRGRLQRCDRAAAARVSDHGRRPLHDGGTAQRFADGFRTLAIQKRSGEVWTILGAVKTEFEKFGTGLQQMQRHLNQTGSDLEELIGPRSRAITRKLESVQQLDPDAAAELLGIEE